MHLLLTIVATIASATVGLTSGVENILNNLAVLVFLMAIFVLLLSKVKGESDQQSLRRLGIVGLFFCLGMIMSLMLNGLVHSGISADRRLEEGLRSLALLGLPLFIASVSVLLGANTKKESDAG